MQLKEALGLRDGEIDEQPTRALSDLRPGERGIFARVSDSNPDMLRYLSELAFFDRALVGTNLRYLGGQQALEQGVDDLLELTRRTILAEGSTLLVVDGLIAVLERFDSWSLRRFLHELQVITAMAAVMFSGTPELCPSPCPGAPSMMGSK